MTDKKKIDEAATLILNTRDGDMQGNLTIHAADEAELVQIIKRAGLDKNVDNATDDTSLTVSSPDGKMSTTVTSSNLRSIMELLRIADAPTDATDSGIETMSMESAEDNDYSRDLSSRKGDVYPGSTSRPGTARAKTIPIPAKSGDNPLAEWGIPSFKEYLEEFKEHVYPKQGDLRPVLWSKYRGEEYDGWGIEQYQQGQYGGDWDIPDWLIDPATADMMGPFSTAEEAQAAINDYWKKSELQNENLDEAPYRDWQARERRFGDSMILLPAEHNVTFDTLDQTYFDPGSYVYVVGKQNSSGNYTPRFCISSGKLNYVDGQEVTVVHDQNRGITPGKVISQFSYDDWMNNRDAVAQKLEAVGIARNKKIPVKVFK